MSEHTKTPWNVDFSEQFDYERVIKGGIGYFVATTHGGVAGIVEAEANARHIVNCVNNHERLVNALSQMHAIAEFRESRNPEVIAAGELLAALEAEKGGEL